MRGSSPLTRGKRVRVATGHGVQGLIPAHAGKTSPSRVTTKHTWAHPRSRGENAVVSLEQLAPAGSSPLTRGKHWTLLTTLTASGLIPAHAGKTWSCPSRSARPWAHPRSRGENRSGGRRRRLRGGSSPLTRGKLAHDRHVCSPPGLIPAHAGKTVLRLSSTVASRAHPRSRGENIRPIGLASMAAGSSPLTRGKLGHALGSLGVDGLIPAHAGKTPIG